MLAYNNIVAVQETLKVDVIRMTRYNPLKIDREIGSIARRNVYVFVGKSSWLLLADFASVMIDIIS